MISKIKTIWKYGIIFADKLEDFMYSHDGIDIGNDFYEGKIEDISRELAEKIVEIHPGYQKYYSLAMMPLWKTYGKNKGGTENPIYAIKSLRTPKENHMEYVSIWKTIDD